MQQIETECEGNGIRLEKCGAWRLLHEIGRGAYGTVYFAIGPDRRRAAVKVCRRDVIGEERYARELRGARLYSAIPPHEGLLRMRELAEKPWGFYAVMDLADDEFGNNRAASADYRPKTLARVIEGEKALPLGECMKLGIALTKGLSVLQRHHLLHRDIKPGNVIYVRGRPVLSDPGLVVEESEAASLVGTHGYDPPEGFTAAPSDVYSLGLTLKAASFGRRVEDLDKGPALEADTGSQYFPAWWRILNKATDPTPSRRYQSAKALIKDLTFLRIKMARPTISAPVWSLIVSSGLLLTIYSLIAYHPLDWVFELFESRSSVLKKVERGAKELSVDAFWGKAPGAFGAFSNSWSLSASLRHTKSMTSNTNVVALIDSAQKELLR